MEFRLSEQGMKELGKASAAVSANFPVAFSQDYASALYTARSGFYLTNRYVGIQSEGASIKADTILRAVVPSDASWVFTYPFYEQDGPKMCAYGNLFCACDNFKKAIRCPLPSAVSSQSLIACALGKQHLVVRSRLLIQKAAVEDLLYKKVPHKDPFNLIFSSVKRGYPKIPSGCKKDFFLQSIDQEKLLVVTGNSDELELLAKDDRDAWHLSVRQVFESALSFVQVNTEKKFIGVALVDSPLSILLYTDELEEHMCITAVGCSLANPFSFSPCGTCIAVVDNDEETIGVHTIVSNGSTLHLSTEKAVYKCSEWIKSAQIAWTFDGIFFGTRHYGYLIFPKLSKESIRSPTPMSE